MEFLRGHYKTANVHFKNGLKLLGELEKETCPKSQDMIVSKPFNHFVDSCIVETFIKLQSQAISFGQAPTDLYPVWQIDSEFSTAKFGSVSEARGSLNHILDEIFYLTEQHSRQNHCKDGIISPELFKRQQQIRTALSSWFKNYDTLQITHPSQVFTRDGFLHIVLKFLYTMADIMIDTCLWSTSQLIYDSHLPDFVSIINQSIGIWKIIMTTHVSRVSPGLRTDISDATADVGWVTPLYFTALKCRNHRVRAQAIRLLRSVPHKEGMWDATMAASIAILVMEIEEKDFCKGIEVDEGFSTGDMLQEEGLSLPALPEANRFHEVEVALPDNEEEKVIVTSKRKLKNGEWEVIVRECEVLPHMRIKKPGRTYKY
jgi:hypothetical protein